MKGLSTRPVLRAWERGQDALDPWQAEGWERVIIMKGNIRHGYSI